MNREIAEKLFETGASVEKLFLVALARETRDFTEFIDELSDKDFSRLFPKIEERSENDCIYQDLTDYDYHGFVAEVNIPISHTFCFEDGVPKSWSSSLGYCRIFNTYAPTIEELVSNIENAAKIQFDEEVAKELKTLSDAPKNS